MPHATSPLSFTYEAADAGGQPRHGTLLAASASVALEALGAQGLRVFSLREVGAAAPTSRRRARVGAEERVWLLDELATLLESGVALAEAVESLQTGHAASALGAALTRIHVQLRAGTPFSQALGDSGLGLPRYVTELTRAGESTGRLAAAARAAAQQLQADQKFAQQVRNALLYPAVLMASGSLAMLVVFVFVVPKFASILANPKADLPLLSQWVLQLGMWMGAHTVLLGLGLAALVGAGVWAARQAEVRQRAWELLARLPLAARWVREAELYRWAAMLGLLSQHRVGLLEALAQANATLRARHMAQQAQAVADAVRQGKSLVEALAGQQMLDAPALALVRVGERSGALDKALNTLAARYQNASQQRIARFLVLLEPITILLISVVLGGVMISVILAVTSLSNVI